MNRMAQRKNNVPVLRLFAIVLLLFNGAGALYGGASLMAYPDGSGIQLSLSLLTQTPFHDYLIPGIVLFTFNGLCSMVVLVMTVKRVCYYDLSLVLQGTILLGWLIVQVLLIRTVDRLQIVMGAIGVALILCGLKIRFHWRSCMTKNTVFRDHGQ